MWQTFCKWLLYKRMGWTTDITEAHPDKYIICLAPHTSNWDFLIGQLYSGAEGIKSNFLMKKEWFFWPLGPLFRRLGGIPVWRSKHTSMTDRLAETARQADTFHLCITPEGTRSPNPDWKKGFYFIAQKVSIPILLYGIDYERRLIQCTKTVIPDGDIDTQMTDIKLYFAPFKGKKPENFTIGDVRKRVTVLLALTLLSTGFLRAQSTPQTGKLTEKIESYLSKYKPEGAQFSRTAHVTNLLIDDEAQTLTVTANDAFAEQSFTPQMVEKIYQQIKSLLPSPYESYYLTINTHGRNIEELIPNRLAKEKDRSRQWGAIDYEGEPWVSNVSQPVKITKGLRGRHLSLWASHGRYYDAKTAAWKWQRPKLFGTTEDLFTQTIVVPYLIPMLENAGAIVFTPRERAWQREEIIVDNDGSRRNYLEATSHGKWKTTAEPGFAYHEGAYDDNENPFTAGTARYVKTTNSKSRYSLASYQPDFPKTGRYAVYVSYQTLTNSIDNAQYTVWHRGERTVFHVNQQMGGGTWVYLGTFEFDKGYSEFNRVTITNQSGKNGVVTTDAVRFGGGMGNIRRGGDVSGYPRAVEGARYYAQWAGMPYTVYSGKEGQDDYADDINVRSLMTNYLAGGSPFVPGAEGKRVPIELSLAVHSDAGYARNGESMIGSLAICTTSHNEGMLQAGISRLASRDLADALLTNVTTEMRQKFGRWNRRELYDRNYSETRVPAVPSTILETLSHQNFPDMRYGQDPHFRFTLARSVYKTLLRYISEQHHEACVVTPLTPDHLRVSLTGKGKARLDWNAVTDPQEPTAKPTGYIVYTAVGEADFDNGTYTSKGYHECDLEPNTLYHFRVAAVNQGGVSFPSEVMSALYTPSAKKTVIIVNGFQRLSSPAVRNTAEEQGFDLDEDPGITYGTTAGWVGRQTGFDRSKTGIETEGGLGWSGEELAGMFIAGNEFNYVATHAKAIASARQYNIVSASRQAVENGYCQLKPYAMADLLLGLERDDGHSLIPYKTFTPALRQTLTSYTRQGGALLVSGAYIGTDMASTEERLFLNNILKCNHQGRQASGTDDMVEGMGTTLHYYHQLNEEHYAATSADILRPCKPAYAVLRYSDGQDAAVAYKGTDYRTLTIGFPFECIKSEAKRNSMMRGMLNYLLK